MQPSSYYDIDSIRRAVEEGRHREVIGGLWKEIGEHQLRFMIEQGLKPSHRLLDVGCGSLRLGALAIAWLDPQRYFGSDLSADLIAAGRERELDDHLRDRAPPEHFSVSDDFDFTFLPEAIDFAIAQSVFTHLPLNHLRRCLSKLAAHMRPGGRFFVTYFDCPIGENLQQPLLHSPGGIVTHDFKDPYHYRENDLAWAIDRSPWRLDIIGGWGHPRDQRMAAFVRL